MATAATIGYGILVEMSTPAAPTVWVEMAEVFDVSPPGDKQDMIDVTSYRSAGGRREFISGLTDGGEVSMEMNYAPGSTTDQWMIAAQGQNRNIRITYPNGVMISFVGVRQDYERKAPVDNKITATATFKVTGTITQSAAAAPANVTAPSISGLPKVGVVLTALEGEWTGVASYTYQWKKGGTNIAGATTRTYTPVSGDIGGSLTITVTATNTTGSTSVTSTAAIAVVA